MRNSECGIVDAIGEDNVERSVALGRDAARYIMPEGYIMSPKAIQI